MKRYTTDTKDTCWPDCLACILEVRPEKVPNFVKLYGHEYMNYTREWLRENFGKGIVYVPAGMFMETARMRNNPPIGPMGYSIVHLAMVNPSAMHVAVGFNGGILWDNGDSREFEYKHIEGYFVIYDLEAPKAKWIKRVKKNFKKPKRKKSV